jgi:hypothetical protein
MTWWIVTVCLVILLFGFVVLRGAPYVPSHRRFVRLALTKLYNLSEKDVLVDLGSGDGLVLRIAAGRASQAIGYELNPALVVISRLLSRGSPKIKTHLADFWLIDLPKETTVVYAFVVTRDVAKLEKKMQAIADYCGHSVWLITYGAKLKKKQPTEVLYAHSLYLFDPSV